MSDPLPCQKLEVLQTTWWGDHHLARVLQLQTQYLLATPAQVEVSWESFQGLVWWHNNHLQQWHLVATPDPDPLGQILLQKRNLEDASRCHGCRLCFHHAKSLGRQHWSISTTQSLSRRYRLEHLMLEYFWLPMFEWNLAVWSMVWQRPVDVLLLPVVHPPMGWTRQATKMWRPKLQTLDENCPHRLWWLPDYRSTMLHRIL